jgi:hypothetical protein
MPQSDDARRIRQRSEAYNAQRRKRYKLNKLMAKTGRPRVDNPKGNILASKKRYRDKKRQEALAAQQPVISYRCKRCGLEGKATVFSSNLQICVWCEYDSNVSSSNGGNGVTAR